MKILKGSINGIVTIILQALVGVFLIIDPFGFTKAVLVTFAAALIVVGIVNILKFIFNRNSSLFPKVRLFAGLIALAAGLIVLCLALLVKKLLSFAVIVYGIVLLVTGIIKLNEYFEAKKFSSYVPKMILLSAGLSVIAGIVIVINPFETTLLTMKVIGIWLIVQCLLDLVPLILQKRAERNIIPEVIDITDYND